MSESNQEKTALNVPEIHERWQPQGVIIRRVPLRPDGSIRLSTLLAATGDFTRKETRRGKAIWGGVSSELDTRIVPTWEPVELRFKRATYQISASPALVLAVHKPAGLVCSHEDENPRAAHLAGGTVFDLIPQWLAIDGLEPVGRLDRDTSGLLLFTELGALSQRLRHPSRAVERRYRATLARPIDEATIARALEDGVTLKDGAVVRPLRLELRGDARLQAHVTITEGRYHEVRRLFAALGSHVEALHREGYGVVTLPEAIPPAIVEGDDIARLTNVGGDGLLRLPAPVTLIDGDARTQLLQSVGDPEDQIFAQIAVIPDEEEDGDDDPAQKAPERTHAPRLRDFDEL